MGNEAYGHGYMHSKGKSDEHNAVSTERGFIDANKGLQKQIHKREKESAQKFSTLTWQEISYSLQYFYY